MSTPATPKHLTECLVTAALIQTANSLSAVAERAWFLTLAHTGLCVSQLLNPRLRDLDLTGARIFIPSATNGQERVAYLRPALANMLRRLARD